ncbi:sporulation protein YabP [Hathewaya histolytica]|uniref:Sporulation protein YabP n=1 Tax=Hathewaya histolytica TaxID=1498 RepID=A0A4U9RSK0_HATHI|nr:sporulation protein YabP [Hathewaya histolytica]VTQ95384.1 sporulation protein YabP [Hathewaya histolytica]
MERKKEIITEERKGRLLLEDRKKLEISGVLEVVSFNEEEIILSTKLGGLNIKGSDLKMNKLDVTNGEVNITGEINSCLYKNHKKLSKDESIFKRLFK